MILDREFYLHLLARSFLFRSQIWRSPYEHYWFLDGNRIFDDLCEWYKCTTQTSCNERPPIAGERIKVVHRPDVFFSRLWESKPFSIFHCLSDEDYANQISSWGKLLLKVEMLTKDEQDFVLRYIFKYGNQENYPYNSAPLRELQQSEYVSQMPEEIRIGEDGGGTTKD